MDLSISVVSWNTRDLLEQCLDSVFSNSGDIDFEVIVVDNASVDRSQAMVRQRFPQVALVQNDTNMGYAAANNQAMDMSRGRYVLLLNSDTIILPGALDGAVRFMDCNSQAGAVGVRTVLPHGSVQATWFGFPSLWSELTGRLRKCERVLPLPAADGRLVDVVETESLAGHYLMLRREALNDIGVMDEEYYMYSEEVDLCRRLWNAGHRLYYLPYLTIIHYLGQSTKQRPLTMKAQLFKSKLLYFRKHHGRSHEFVLRLGFGVVFAAKWLGFAAASVAALGRHEHLNSRRQYYSFLLRNLCGLGS
jgi:GT2 family glycosyltransferase